MVSLRVNGHLHSIPEAWNETSTGLYQRIVEQWDPDKAVEDRDRVKLFSIMIDKPYKAIAESTDEMLAGVLYACTCFVYEEALDFTPSIPRVLFVGERAVDLPQDAGILTVGQNIIVRQLMASTKDRRLVISKVVAVYLQRHYDARLKDDRLILADFNYDRAMEIEPVVASVPITITAPIAFFLYSRLNSYGTGFTSRFVAWILRNLVGVRL